MANETIVRDRFQRIIGYIETTGSEQIARDKHRTILGFYSPRDDYTRDKHKMLYGAGDHLMSLITNAAG